MLQWLRHGVSKEKGWSHICGNRIHICPLTFTRNLFSASGYTFFFILFVIFCSHYLPFLSVLISQDTSLIQNSNLAEIGSSQLYWEIVLNGMGLIVFLHLPSCNHKYLNLTYSEMSGSNCHEKGWWFVYCATKIAVNFAGGMQNYLWMENVWCPDSGIYASSKEFFTARTAEYIDLSSLVQ